MMRASVALRRRSIGLALAAAVLVTPGPAFAAEPTMAQMQWHRRVLILSTPSAADPQYLSQQQALSVWTGGEDRDLSVVRLEGNAVSGSREAAEKLRNRYRLPDTRFAVALIGKDGHVALRSPTALSGTQLEAVIDAMPMRKAGER
jgi:hypothetical protein